MENTKQKIELLIAQAPAPEPAQSPQTTQSTLHSPLSTEEITLILPEEEPMPMPMPIIPVADYIDELLAQNIELEDALLTSMIDPNFDNSYTPLN